MKKIFTAIFFCFTTAFSLQAQDIITKRSGEKLEAKVLEITLQEIKYKAYSNLDGPLYTLPKQEVLLIQYENSTTETFELNEAVASSNNVIVSHIPESAGLTPTDLYHKGRTDADIYYTNYKTAGTAVLVTSLLSPLVGLVPAIITSASPPKTQNLEAPSFELLNKPDYVTGYKAEAKKVKSRKVWKNWGIGLGVNIVLVVLLASNQ